MSVFDKDLQVGDIIKAYHAGIHRLTKIEPRFYTKEDDKRDWGKLGQEYTSLIYYDRVLNNHFKKSNRKDLCCDAAYCKKLTAEWVKNELEEKRKVLEEAFSTLLEFIENNTL